jgi:C-terminal processing protease CtpA/Prc
MKAATVAILLCSAPAFLTQPAGSMPGVRNQFNMETIGRKLKDVIAVDIQKNREILQELVDLQTNETEQMYKYIDQSIEKLSNVTFFALKKFKNNTEENLENMKTTMKHNLESINAKVDANNKKVVESIMGANGSALALTKDWMKARSEAIEVSSSSSSSFIFIFSF